jgi:hypothetical protein
MNTLEGSHTVGFLRRTEMQELVDSEKDPITEHLMEMAAQVVFSRVVRKERPPIADFDLRYFMEVVQDFAGQHETLKTILAGRGSELVWLDME